MMRRSILMVAVVIGVSVGCTEDAATGPSGGDAGENGAAPSASAGVPTGTPEAAYVAAVSPLRREPSDAAKVDDPKAGAGKKVGNWLTTLHRGEKVTVLGVREAWARVRASDESEGWMKKDGLLPIDGVSMATVLEDTKVFARPDLLAFNPAKKVDAGTLLYVLKSREQFSEVNLQGNTTVWVLSEKLTLDSREVEASKVLDKVRWLEERKDPSAKDLRELLLTQFADTKLVRMLTQEPGAAPPASADPEGPAPAAVHEPG